MSASNNVAEKTSSTAPPSIGESTIRRMTRLAEQHGAVNLSQGFPNEPPPLSVRVALARSALSGAADMLQDDIRLLDGVTDSRVDQIMRRLLLTDGIPGVSTAMKDCSDVVNQYSPPMGRSDLRKAVSDHYKLVYDYTVSPDNITITLGATEAVASSLRTIGRPGDKVVFFEPFHELYPSQCRIFYLEPVYVTLRENAKTQTWNFDLDELEKALPRAKILILNTPHNPTGKVFSHEDLKVIIDLCLKLDVYIVTDEIYEHMVYGNKKHTLLPKAFPSAASQILVCNSIGKSASATGWRVGWCLHPPHLSNLYRGVHDQMVVMAPHPQQYATITYLSLPKSYFFEVLKTRYAERLKILSIALHKAGFGVSCPEGAYYLFARYRLVPELSSMKPMDAAMHMVQVVGVACVPGDNFYGSSQGLEIGQEYLRFAACRSLSDVWLACQKLKNAFDKR